jgi:acetolactate synthase-1/2/3 large subunit/sulfoacetaldehyde acetyltransferase
LPGTEHLGRDTFQEIDQHVLFQPVTKRTFSVPRPERIPAFILEAFRIANAGRRGPVVVNIPRDLFNHEIDVTLPASGGQPVVASGAVDSATLEQIKGLLLAARPGDPCWGWDQVGTRHGQSAQARRGAAAPDHDLGRPW